MRSEPIGKVAWGHKMVVNKDQHMHPMYSRIMIIIIVVISIIREACHHLVKSQLSMSLNAPAASAVLDAAGFLVMILAAGFFWTLAAGFFWTFWGLGAMAHLLDPCRGPDECQRRSASLGRNGYGDSTLHLW